jgi:hypothetical protein
MPCIVREGESRRWCQQCGKFQPLVDFEAQKRTCRRKVGLWPRAACAQSA